MSARTRLIALVLLLATGCADQLTTPSCTTYAQPFPDTPPGYTVTMQVCTW
jgi:hypothetical protein